MEKTVLIFVGRIDDYKRPIDAIKLINLLNGDYFLIMIGTGTMEEQLQKEIKKSFLKNNIRRIEKIPNKEIHKYYAASDFYLNFNRKEIFGMSILEAMYSGCTVLAYHAPGPDYIIKDKVSGYLVNNLDDMKKIIVDDKKLDRNCIIKTITEKFVWDQTAQKIDTWIKENITPSIT